MVVFRKGLAVDRKCPVVCKGVDDGRWQVSSCLGKGWMTVDSKYPVVLESSWFYRFLNLLHIDLCIVQYMEHAL